MGRKVLVILFLAGAGWRLFARLAPTVTQGSRYCRRVDLGSRWQAPPNADAQTVERFRSGYGELSFRLDERDSTHVLVAFTGKQYSSYHGAYSVNKYRLPIVPEAWVEPASDQDWERATPLGVYAGTPFESASPLVDTGGVQWRADTFANRKPFRGTPPLLTSPDGNWLAVQSWEGHVPYCEFFCDGTIAKGTVALDVYRTASVQQTVTIDVAFSVDLPDAVTENSRWISDRHLVFPVNAEQTHLMICDLSDFYQDRKPVWNRGNAAEILGIFHEGVSELQWSQIRAIRLNSVIRVPEPGTYKLKTTVEDPQGNQVPAEGQGTFAEAGTHRIEFIAGIGRLEANARLIIRQATLLRQLQHGEQAVAALRGPVRLASYNFIDRPYMKARPSTPGVTIPLPLPVLQTSAVDDDHNGKFEYLRTRATLVLPGGQCNWSASLLDLNGTIIAFANGQDKLAPGEQSLDLYFDGGRIAGKGWDGPYHVEGLTIECLQREQRFALLNGAQLKSTTAAFRASQFEHLTRRPYWKFTGVNDVQPLDINADGKFELLQVRIGYDSNLKHCRADAVLRGSSNSWVAFATSSEDAARPGSLVFLFSGEEVKRLDSAPSPIEIHSVTCQSETGGDLYPPYDGNYRVPVPPIELSRFQSPLQITFSRTVPPVQDGSSITYTIDCAPLGVLPYPVFFRFEEGPAGATGLMQPDHAHCTAGATKLRLTVNRNLPPSTYALRVGASLSPPGQHFNAYLAEESLVPMMTAKVLSVIPSSGAGRRGVFRIDLPNSSASDVHDFELLFQESQTPAHACLVSWRSAVGASLVNDDGTGQVPRANDHYAPLENSQCMVAEPRINRATEQTGLSLFVTFKPSFFGKKNIYVRVFYAAGRPSEWKQAGTWLASAEEPPAAISIAPYLGTGGQQTFTFAYSDPNGYADLTSVEGFVQFDREKSNACWFVFNPRAQSLALMNDAGQTPVASLHVGGNGTASNSQCAIRNLKIVEQAGRALRVSLDIQFAKTFAGRRNLYARAKDPWNGDPAWQWLGSWDVR